MSLPDRLTIEVVTTATAFEALRDEWNAALGSAAVPNVFATWEWASTWWRHFGREGGLHIVVLRDSDGVAAIAPLQRSLVGLGPARTAILERISPEAGDYGGIIVARRVADVAEALADHVVAQLASPRLAAVVLSRVASDDPFLDAWRHAVERRRSRIASDEQRLEGTCLYTDVRHEDFKLSKHTKKHKIRQRLRRITEDHERVDFTYHRGDDLERGLDMLLEVHRRRWADREGELQGLLAAPDREAFMLDAIRALDGAGWLRLLTLAADDRPVAAELDFQFGDRIFMFKGAFDPEFSPYSPGQLLHHRVFEDGMDEGINVFDFGRGDQSYKQRWANGERHLVTTTVVRTGTLGRIGSARLRATRALAVRGPDLLSRDTADRVIAKARSLRRS